MKPKILLIEDDTGTRFGFSKFLASGYDIAEAEDIACAEQAFETCKYDALILDVNLPDGNGLDFIDRVRANSPNVPIIVITGAGDIPLAVNAMRRGADNFLTKPVDMNALELFLKKTLEVGIVKKFQSSRQRLEKKEGISFGLSPAMKDVATLARIAAENDSPVLITGETGTGKGMIAKWIHCQGNRSAFSFVDVNCSGLKGDLLAREIFGNVRGAFTSADRDRDGLLDVADKGTLFLDEIGEMDPSVQAQFLKVLEEKTYRRLGDTKLQRSDFRLICATNKHIEAEVRNGNFRRDLHYRINLLTIHIPPLRERMIDLPALVRHIMKSTSPQTEITEDAMGILKAYPWPGNVRELRNMLERATILSRGDMLTPEHFAWLKNAASPLPASTGGTLEEVEHIHILAALERCGGNVERAAKSIGISRATFYRRLKGSKGNL